MTKNQFLLELNNKCISLDHISRRKLDYKYYEYLLFQILIKYPHYEEFKVLGLPNNLEIKFFPEKDKDYNINSRTHVTLNYQLYKLFECGYFSSESRLVESTLEVIRCYQSSVATIKQLDTKLRNIRIDFIKYNII